MNRSGRGICWATVSVVLAIATLAGGEIVAQQGVRVFGRARGRIIIRQGPQVTDSFSVAAVTQDFSERLETYQQHIEAQRWEKAFAALDELEAIEPEPMIRNDEGLIIPFSGLRRQLLLNLPAEGRRAYAVMREAEANALLAKLEGATPTSERDTLREVRERFFITPAGAAAADRLGDACFEAGDFAQAAESWRSLLNHPEPGVPMPFLMVKLAHAAARAGDWRTFDDARRIVATRYASERVTVAGREVPAAEALRGIGDNRDAAVAPGGGGGGGGELPPSFALPPADRIAWKLEFLDEQGRQLLMQGMRNQGIGGAAEFTPAVATDGKRVFLHWFGGTSAHDAATGRPVWEKNDLPNMANRAGQVAAYGHAGMYWARLTPDGLLCAGPDPQRSPMIGLACLNPDNGQPKWSAANDATLQQYSFIGRPLIVETTLYVAALSQQKRELVLLALDPKTGSPRWDLTIGTPAMHPNMGWIIGVEPRLAHDRGTMCVLTNDGAVVAVDLARRKMVWAYTYEALPGATYPFNAKPAGDAVLHNGVLAFKDTRADRLVAVRVSDGAPLWRHEVGSNETVLGSDGRLIFTAGSEVAAYAFDRGEKTWWSTLTGDSGGWGALETRDHLVLAAQRGVFQFDKAGGKIVGVIEAELGARGGRLLRAGDHLICVGPNSLTAYTIETPAAAPK